MSTTRSQLRARLVNTVLLGTLWASLGASAHATCDVTTGPEVAPGLPSVRATCHWPEVSPRSVRAVLEDLDSYEQVFWMVDRDEVLGEQDGATLVRQIQVAPVVQPRDALVQVWTEGDDTGHFEVRWSLAPSAPGPAPGHVQPALNEGAWLIDDDGLGGTRLSLDLAYDPGGWVPTWLVRWCQDEGARRALAELKEASLGRERVVVRTP